MMDELVTYADVARWLPTDVRDRIEATVPCMGGGEHDWRHTSYELRTASSAFTRTVEWWSCTRPGCDLTVKVDPVRVAP